MQTGEYCRLPKTPRSECRARTRFRVLALGQRMLTASAPRSVAKHYFDEHINTPSEFGDGSLYSAYTAASGDTDWWVTRLCSGFVLTIRRDQPEPEDL